MKIAFYMRLSVADGDLDKKGKNESNSIESQRMLLKSYLTSAALDATAVTEYVDDGYSGLNFNRPSFTRMMDDAREGEIDMIVVKDLSRLGRDYIGVGDYIEQIFPILGIRFVAINSNYDSIKYIGSTPGPELSIDSFINTLYCKDISKKLKSALRTKWKKGVSTCGRLPFGYVKDKIDPRKWRIDREAAGYVRLIFDLALKGCGTKLITEYLNDHNIPTPGKYRVAKTGSGDWNRVISDAEWFWDTAKVWRIIKNYTYTGAMVHGQTTVIRVGSHERRTIPERDRFIAEGAHDAIVTVEEFEKAQTVLRNVRVNGLRRDNGFLLTGKIRCGNCRLRMSYQNAARQVIVCKHKISVGKKSACSAVRYDARHIERMVWAELNQKAELIERLSALTKAVRDNNKSVVTAEKRSLKRDIQSKKARRVQIYEHYVGEYLEKEEFVKQKSQLTAEIDRLCERLALLDGETKAINSLLCDIARLKESAARLIKGDALTREAVREFIDTIYVQDAEHIEVKLLFDDLLEKAAAYAGIDTEKI